MNIESWNPIGFLERSFKFDIQNRKSEVTNLDSRELPGIYLKRLDWDSTFFDAEIFKILFLNDKANSENALAFFSEKKNLKKRTQFFLEISSEAVDYFSLLTQWGFSLIETRLTYFHQLDDIPKNSLASRNAVKKDIPMLRKVASGAVNYYDRYHSDKFFSNSDTDRYLEEYIENCVNGFAEKVFVPNLETEPASFVAVSRVN